MRTHDNLAVAAELSVDPGRWREQFDELMGRVAGRFPRVEPRRRARAFVLGLLSGMRRKNCWTIAEHAGDATPDGMQHLLAAARWDAGALRDDVRGYVVEHLGDAGAVLVVDETGDVKKGSASAGVQRQYTGTAGRVENCQVAVFLSYASPAGHALIDRELYLPKSWITDAARCAAAGIPAGTAFATKPKLARVMIARALDAAVPARWVTGDEVYGGDPGLRAELERRRTGYVLAVAVTHRVATAAVTCQARQIAARLPRRAWQRYSAGEGAKGHRYYDWVWVSIDPALPGHRWLLIRRNRRTGELAFYRCYSPGHVPLPALVKVAGIRWTTEENFQAAKGLTGLDEHQVRRWTAPDGRLFQTYLGGIYQPSTLWRVLQTARRQAFTPAQLASPLAHRPYDFRHAGVSWRLNAGTPAPLVAEWAGHTVEVLLRIYAHCIDGDDERWFGRMEDVLGRG